MILLIIPACIMFEDVYFFLKVLLKGDDDDTVSEKLQIAAFVIYGIGAFLTSLMFLGTISSPTETEKVPKSKA